MGFNSMFSSLAGEVENSDRIFTKNGAKVKFIQNGKAPTVFAILPAIDPNNPDKNVSYLPAILPNGDLSDWGSGAWVYRGIGHSPDWKERCDVVSLRTVGEECPLDLLVKTIKGDPTWAYLMEEIGKWGDKDRVRATIPRAQQFMFCNVFMPNDQDRTVHVGIFSKTLANKLVGENGFVFQPSPSATDEMIQQNYLAKYANGDITSPQGAVVWRVEKGHDKGEMSGYELTYSLDASRRVMHQQLTQDLLGARYNLNDVREYLNILTADQIVQLLIRELNGRSPAGYHEYALLKLAFGSRWQIPEPPSAPGAMATVPSGFTAEAVPAPAPAAVPAAPVPTPAPAPTASPAPVPAPSTVPPAAVPAATVSAAVQPAAPVPGASPEANAALNAAVKAGAAAPTAAPAAAAAPQVTGDPVPAFNKEAFLARLAKGGNQ